MKRLLLIVLPLLLIVGCSMSTTKYNPFIDLNLLSGLKIGESLFKVKSLLGEPLIIIKKSSDEEMWKYEYRYKNRKVFEPGEKVVGGLKKRDEHFYSDKSDHDIFIHFKDKRVIKIIIDDKFTIQE